MNVLAALPIPPSRPVKRGRHTISPADREHLDAVAEGRLSPVEALEALARSGEGLARTNPLDRAAASSQKGARIPRSGAPLPHPGDKAPSRPPPEKSDGSRRNSAPPPPARIALASLESLVGLEKVKRIAYEVYAVHAVASLRRALDLPAEDLSYHMIFTGRPGTGKTTVARAFAQAFHAMGALSRGHLVEVDRADIVGEYVGHTAQRTREAVARAKGGVLFVDEAYSLSRGGDKDFGREALDTLVRLMEEDRADLVVILAGYPDEMETLLTLNPGLRSRVPIRIDFPDYTLGELTAIARQFYADRGYALTQDAERYLPHRIARLLLEEERAAGGPGPSAGNARTVRNLVEASLRRQAVRILTQIEAHPDAASDRELLTTIAGEDLSEPARVSQASPDAHRAGDGVA